MLTYLQVHIYYNLPPLLLLYFLYRPLTTKGDARKYLFLIVISVLWTTPWDNYIIYRKAWWYCSRCVIGTIGYVPIEEYIFFVTQTLTTCLLYSLLTRIFCGLPAINIRGHGGFPWEHFLIITSGVVCMASWWVYGFESLKTFYIRAITMWTMPVLLFLYTVVGLTRNFVSSRTGVVLFSIAIPTVYLWIVDTIAIRAGTWHINEAMSLEVFLWEGLPFEEAVFFLVTNTMVVLGCTGFDLAFSIVHTYEQTLDFSFASLCRALLTRRDTQVIDDLEECVKILQEGSSSFYTSSFFFNEAIRRDLIVLYSFCRYTDDIADESLISVDIRKERLQEVKAFVRSNFRSKAELHQYVRLEETFIKQNARAVERSMMRYLAHKIPRESLLELLEGYEWDLELDADKAHNIVTEKDLIKYSNHVASSVAECCMYIIHPEIDSETLRSARDMGVVLQLTNIARDILTDAEMGRVYLPLEWLKDKDRDKFLQRITQPSVEFDENSELCLHALRLLDSAANLYQSSTSAIHNLPPSARLGLKVSTNGYYAIGSQLRRQCMTHYPRRARLSKTTRMWIILKELYRPSIADALLFSATALRIMLIVYGNWQDNLGGNVRYTDVDYNVFTDAAAFVHAGKSPYERATYRYTPLLAWLLIPNQYFPAWGKVLFALGDLMAGSLMLRVLRARKVSILWSATWLLNPMVAVISTRGNCEGLLGAMAISLIYFVERGQVSLAGIILGLAVHFKIYPLMYAPSLVLSLPSAPSSTISQAILRFFNHKRIILGLTATSTFFILSSLMYYIYGTEFLQHTFLYHISRSDHRHNFSAYHLLLYLQSAPTTALTSYRLVPLLAFIPQFLLAFILIPLGLAKTDLIACMFAQTFAFVTFNKVVTSQYFMWYLVFLPLYLPGSKLISQRGLFLLLLWIVSQASWLYFAYGFEMLGQDTFYNMWLSTLFFFLTNIVILGEVIRGHETSNGPRKKPLT